MKSWSEIYLSGGNKNKEIYKIKQNNIKYCKTVYVDKKVYITFVNPDYMEFAYVAHIHGENAYTVYKTQNINEMLNFVIDSHKFSYILTSDVNILDKLCINLDAKNITNTSNPTPKLYFDPETQLKKFIYKEEEKIVIRPVININTLIPINLLQKYETEEFIPTVYIWRHLCEVMSKYLKKTNAIIDLEKFINFPYWVAPNNLKISYSTFPEIEIYSDTVFPICITEPINLKDTTINEFFRYINFLYEINLKKTNYNLLSRHLFYISQLNRIFLYHENITIYINKLNKNLYKQYGHETSLHEVMKKNPIYEDKYIDKYYDGDEVKFIDLITSLSPYTLEDTIIV